MSYRDFKLAVFAFTIGFAFVVTEAPPLARAIGVVIGAVGIVLVKTEDAD